MIKHRCKTRSPRILLSGVFGPYGVNDEFGRKSNIMELFHNQVTKGQGLASYRFHHRSFGLYLLAANVDADVTVLDFPTRSRFIKEIKGNYDIIGISFITPNLLKAREMARLCRKYAPAAEIVLGGHGAAIEGVEGLIECDHVVKGEGIRWLREHLGQDPDDQFYHPTLPVSDWQTIYGVPVPGQTNNLLVPGVGCVNACNFCATSHFFGKSYTSFLKTGKEIFDVCVRISEERGSDDFWVMDENFLKDNKRAMELLAEMERNERYFNFYIFSSAEAILQIGIENMLRLGVIFVWIGFESRIRQGNYQKNAGVDADVLVKQLRDVGIAVLASSILCLEEHTQENIQEDIDFMIGLKADMVQFMLYTSLPVTALYEQHKRQGLIKENLPYEDWHGQEVLNWNHPEFPENSAGQWLNKAFKEEYEQNSCSIYRAIETVYRGYKSLSMRDDLDRILEARKDMFEARIQEYRIMLDVILANAGTEREKQMACDLQDEITSDLGPLPLRSKLRGLVGRALAAMWKLRVFILGDMKQPRTIYTQYPARDQIAFSSGDRVSSSRQGCDAAGE